MFGDLNKDGKINLDDLQTKVFGMPVWVLLVTVAGGVYYFLTQKKGGKRFRF